MCKYHKKVTATSPGWHFDPHTEGPFLITAPGTFETGRTIIAELKTVSFTAGHMIAAAPDLLNAAKRAVDATEGVIGCGYARELLLAAIAKAEGNGE